MRRDDGLLEELQMYEYAVVLDQTDRENESYDCPWRLYNWSRTCKITLKAVG